MQIQEKYLKIFMTKKGEREMEKKTVDDAGQNPTRSSSVNNLLEKAMYIYVRENNL